MFNRLSQLLARPAPPVTKTNTVADNTFVIFNDAIVPYTQYRGIVETEYRRLIAGQSGVSDYALTEAVKVSVVAMSAIAYRATVVGSIPDKVIEPNGDECLGHPFAYYLSHAPRLKQDVTRSLLTWGRSYLQKTYNEHGYPTGLKFLNPNNIQEHIGVRNEIVGYTNTFTYERFEVNQVVYISLFDLDGKGKPLSPLENAFINLNINRNIAIHGASFFLNSARIDGFLSFEDKPTSAQLEDSRKEWKSFKGSANAHKTAVLQNGAKWNPVSAPPADLAMVELTDQNKQEILSAFGVPPALVGLGDTSDPLNASNTLEATKRNFVEVTALGDNDLINDALNVQWTHTDFYPRDYYSIVSNPLGMGILSDVNTDRTTISNANVSGGIWSYNESREYLGYTPQENSDTQLFITQHPSNATMLYEGGHITWNQSRLMLGLPIAPLDMIKVDGVTYPVSRIAEVLDANVTNLSASSGGGFGFNSFAQSQPPLPTPNEPQQLNIKVEREPYPALPQPIEAPLLRAMRNDPIIIAVDFSDHQFVRYARRQLADVLTNANITATWIKDTDWQLGLMTIQTESLQESARVIRTLQLADTPRIDLWSSGYRVHDGAIYLTMDTSEDLNVLTDTIHMEAGREGSTLTYGIRLAHADVSQDLLETIPAQRYPLVVDNLTLYLGDKVQRSWALRADVTAQLKELKNWRHTVDRKGIAYEFAPIKLQGSPVIPFVQWGLSQGVDHTRLFDTATQMLQGDVPYLSLRGDMPIESDSLWTVIKMLSNDYDAEDTAVRSQETYRLALRRLVRGLWAGELTLFMFVDSFRIAIHRAFRQAWIEGALREGVQESEFTTREVQLREEMENRELTYVLGFAQDILDKSKANGGQLNPVLSRIDGWLTRYNEVANRAVLVASGDKKKKWSWNASAEHCKDCQRLNGRVYRASTWERWNLRPGSTMLNCFGNCKCDFVDTDEPLTSGRPPNLIGARYDETTRSYVPSEHTHDDSDTEIVVH